jgi:hypothetical protein
MNNGIIDNGMDMRNYSIVKRWMKSMILLVLVAFLPFFVACNEQDIPAGAQDFIKEYFPKSSVVLVETDNDDEGMEYCVWLNDGTKVEFDLQGVWKRVSRNKTGVPAKLVPTTISDFVKTNYPGNIISKLSKKTYGYKIELSDDMDLRFDFQGNFIEEVD